MYISSFNNWGEGLRYQPNVSWNCCMCCCGLERVQNLQPCRSRTCLYIASVRTARLNFPPISNYIHFVYLPLSLNSTSLHQISTMKWWNAKPQAFNNIWIAASHFIWDLQAAEEKACDSSALDAASLFNILPIKPSAGGIPGPAAHFQTRLLSVHTARYCSTNSFNWFFNSQLTTFPLGCLTHARDGSTSVQNLSSSPSERSVCLHVVATLSWLPEATAFLK